MNRQRYPHLSANLINAILAVAPGRTRVTKGDWRDQPCSCGSGKPYRKCGYLKNCPPAEPQP